MRPTSIPKAGSCALSRPRATNAGLETVSRCSEGRGKTGRIVIQSPHPRDDTVADELTGRETEPDETFLRAVDEQLPVPSDRKDAFRQEVSNWVSLRPREARGFDPP